MTRENSRFSLNFEERGVDTMLMYNTIKTLVKTKSFQKKRTSKFEQSSSSVCIYNFTFQMLKITRRNVVKEII